MNNPFHNHPKTTLLDIKKKIMTFVNIMSRYALDIQLNRKKNAENYFINTTMQKVISGTSYSGPAANKI